MPSPFPSPPINYALVRDPNVPSMSEPILSAYIKNDHIQPVQIMGSSSGITGMDSIVKTGVTTVPAAVVGSSVSVKKSTLRVRSVGTGSYVAVGGSDRQEVQLVVGGSVDLWCSNLDQVYVKSDVGTTSVVEVLYGY